MMTPYSTNAMLDVFAGKSAEPVSLNEDINAHRRDAPVVERQSWPMRLLPGFVTSWIAARKYEQSLVRVWEVSPHLLNDMGIVLTARAALPEHLVAAPIRVIDHIAAIAPEQIVSAEMSFPSASPAGAAAIPAGKANSDPVSGPFLFASAI